MNVLLTSNKLVSVQLVELSTTPFKNILNTKINTEFMKTWILNSFMKISSTLSIKWSEVTPSHATNPSVNSIFLIKTSSKENATAHQ